MKIAALFVFAVLAVPGTAAGTESIREDLRRLIEQDVKSGGQSAPKGQRLAPLKREAFYAADPEIVTLPKFEVTAKKNTKLDAQLSEIERQQGREEKASEPALLDTILNPAFLGGASASARAAAAQHRVEALDGQRILLISLQEAKTPEERARIKSDMELLKGLVR